MPKKPHRHHQALVALRAFGLAYPGAHTKSPWPGHLDLAVNDKTFTYLSVDGEPLHLSCKLPASSHLALTLPFTKPTAYGLGKSGWVTAEFDDGDDPPVELLKQWIDESYRAQAPKALVKQLGAALRTAPGPSARSSPARLRRRSRVRPLRRSRVRPLRRSRVRLRRRSRVRPLRRRRVRPRRRGRVRPLRRRRARPHGSRPAAARRLSRVLRGATHALATRSGGAVGPAPRTSRARSAKGRAGLAQRPVPTA